MEGQTENRRYLWRSERGSLEVCAELQTQDVCVHLVRYHFAEPPSSVLRPNGVFRLELSLTPRHRSARGCFSDRWSAHRFERIGEVFIASPDLPLLAGSDESGWQTSVVCELKRDRVIELFDDEPRLTNDHLTTSLDIRDERIRGLLARLGDEARQPGFASQLMVEHLSGQMAIELVRLGAGIVEGTRHGGLAGWQLRVIDERLREVREAPTLPVLAELCRVSVRHLTRAFRESRGSSLGAYVARSQMEHAKALLGAGMQLKQISGTLGFSSASNFSVAFRRTTGLTPRQYRDALRRPH